MEKAKKFTFQVKGNCLKEIQQRVADHVSRGAVLIGEIKEEYYQSKAFNQSDYRSERQFRENYEKANYVAVMEKEHVENSKRKNWHLGGF